MEDHRIRIKICGISNEKEAEWLNEQKVDFAGFVLFFPKSRRNISIEKAMKIMSRLDPGIKTVAVTVKPSLEELMEIRQAGFDFVQIHGKVDEEVLCHASIPILKAFNGKDFSEFEKYRSNPRIAGYVFDAQVPGSGEKFDWKMLKQIVPEAGNGRGHSWESFLKDEQEEGRIILLAGGLTPDNVAEAVRATRIPGVDVSSGVENDNGIGKNKEKIHA